MLSEPGPGLTRTQDLFAPPTLWPADLRLPQRDAGVAFLKPRGIFHRTTTDDSGRLKPRLGTDSCLLGVLRIQGPGGSLVKKVMREPCTYLESVVCLPFQGSWFGYCLNVVEWGLEWGL